MIIRVDSNEFALHPQIVELLKFVLAERKGIHPYDYEIYLENDVISEHLECGDYMWRDILVEHMQLSDFCGKVVNGRIFQQAQDMLYTKEVHPQIKPFIMISGNATDIGSISIVNKEGELVYPYKMKPMIAAFSSLNRIGVPTSFVGSQELFVYCLIDLFEKFYDGKNRSYNPVRKPVQLQDEVLTNYCGIPEISEGRARLLQQKFPTPKLLYNATKEQLMEVDGIGDKISNGMVDFFNGIKPKEVTKIGDQIIWEIICHKCSKTFRSPDKDKRECNTCKPLNTNKIDKV